MKFDRITHDPNVMGGEPCIRGMRVTVATGKSRDRILEAYPWLEAPDLDAALAYAAWRVEVRIYPT